MWISNNPLCYFVISTQFDLLMNIYIKYTVSIFKGFSELMMSKKNCSKTKNKNTHIGSAVLQLRNRLIMKRQDLAALNFTFCFSAFAGVT